MDAFRLQLLANGQRLTPIVDQMAHFSGTTSVVRVPVYIVSNPEETSGGGEANGGRLVIEVPSPAPTGFVLHEALHFQIPARGRTGQQPLCPILWYGIVIRPTLRAALANGVPLAAFLPQAIARWRTVSPR